MSVLFSYGNWCRRCHAPRFYSCPGEVVWCLCREVVRQRTLARQVVASLQTMQKRVQEKKHG